MAKTFMRWIAVFIVGCISLSARAQDHLDLFATGNDGAVWSASWEASRDWYPWFLVHNEVKMQPGATVTALWRSNDTHLDLFATGNDGAVWSASWEASRGWYPWFLVHNEVKMQPGATVTALWRSNDTHLDLFATGNDGAVWSTSWEASRGWYPWFLVHNEVKMQPGATVTALWRSDDTHLDLFATGNDGAVWSASWEASRGWYPWFLVHNEVKMQRGATVTALWRSNDMHLDLFATGNDGAVWSASWEASRGWYPWFLVHNEVKMQPGATVTALWRSNDTHLDLFATGNDGAVWSTSWEASRGWYPWFLVHKEVKMQPGATVTALWRNTPIWSAASKALDLVWITNSDGTAFRSSNGTIPGSGVDANGLPLNPVWQSQVNNPQNSQNNPNFAYIFTYVCNPRIAGPPEPPFWYCSSQNPQADLYTGDLSSFGVCNQPDTVMGGHLNFQIATYTGTLWFNNWSTTSCCNPLDKDFDITCCGNDHDFNLSLLHGDYSGLTFGYSDEDVAPPLGEPPSGPPSPSQAAIHLEFNSDESIDKWFGSSWWQDFRKTVESGQGFVPLSGSPAIVTGLFGIDGVHRGGYTELHPIFSMALHDATNDPDTWGQNEAGQQYVDQHWHFFIRNSGTEGTCSHMEHSWSPPGGDYTIQLPWAVLPSGQAAASVKMVAGEAYAPPYPPGNPSPPTPSYDVSQGKWTFLHFYMPNAEVVSDWYTPGWDGYITLEYTFPAGVSYKPQVRTASVSRTNLADRHPEKEIDWTQILPRISDPAVKLHLPLALSPTPAANSVAPQSFQIVPGRESVGKRPVFTTETKFLPREVPVDPVRARIMDAEMLGMSGFSSTTFQRAPDSENIFVLGADGSLWLDQPPFGHIPPNRVRVTNKVRTFQALDTQTVDVLDANGNLWLYHGPFGRAAREHIHANVLSFHALDAENVFVLDRNRTLWLNKAPFGSVPPLRTQIDMNVRAFQPLDAQDILIVDTADNLWLESVPSSGVPGNRQQVDANVWSFYAARVNRRVFVLASDDSLWLDEPPFGSVPPRRRQIDTRIRSIAALNNLNAVWALGMDGKLWLEQAPFTRAATNRQQIDENVAAFEPLDLNHVIVLGNDGNLWLEQAPFGGVPPSKVQIDTGVR